MSSATGAVDKSRLQRAPPTISRSDVSMATRSVAVIGSVHSDWFILAPN